VKPMITIEAPWLRLLWLGLLVAASAALTAVYTCVTPFAAFAVLAATTLSRREGLILMAVLWLANQAVGFGVLSYPRTTETFGWGITIGAAALIGTLAAQWTVERLGSVRALGQTVGAFVSAFAHYQVALFALAVPILGGAGAFSPGIIGQVLAINAGALIGLVGLSQLVAAAAGLHHRRRVQAAAARLA
jgi:hypothetical protein